MAILDSAMLGTRHRHSGHMLPVCSEPARRDPHRGSGSIPILVAGICLCWRALRVRQVVLIETLTIGSGIVITLWIAFHTDVFYPAFYQLLLPQTHVGNLIMHVYTLWLTILIVQVFRASAP